MAKKFFGPEDDGIAVPKEVKVERTGTKKLTVPSASDDDIKKAPKPTVVSDRSSWSEANKLDYQVSIDAGRSPEEAAARIEARRAKAQRVQASKQPQTPVSKPSAGTRTPTSPARQSTAGRGSSTPAPVQARTSSVGVPSKRPSKPEVRSSSKPTPPVLVDKPKPAAKAGSSSPAPAKDKGRPQAKPSVRVNPMVSGKAAPKIVPWGSDDAKFQPDERDASRRARLNQIRGNIEAREEAKKPKYGDNTSGKFVGPVDTFRAASARFDKKKKGKKK